MHGWVGGRWPPIDPEMSGSQVVLRPRGFAPDSTERFSRSQTGNSAAGRLCLSWPNLSEASRPLLPHRNSSKLPLKLWNKRQMTKSTQLELEESRIVTRGVSCSRLFCSRPAFPVGFTANGAAPYFFPQIQMSSGLSAQHPSLLFHWIAT